MFAWPATKATSDGGGLADVPGIAKPDQLLYGSDYAWTPREHPFGPA
jgi:hypothetical protein